jgi:hypothetical protein
MIRTPLKRKPKIRETKGELRWWRARPHPKKAPDRSPVWIYFQVLTTGKRALTKCYAAAAARTVTELKTDYQLEPVAHPPAELRPGGRIDSVETYYAPF